MKGKKASVLAPVMLTALAGTVIVGCGTGNQAASNGTSKTGSQGSGGTLKIIMWVNPPAVNAVKKIDAEFEKKYGIKVDLQTMANDTTGYQTLQQTAVQAGTADIMAIQPFDPMPANMSSSNLSKTQEWAVNNVFMPLNGQPWLSKFNTKDLQAAAYNGKDYGLVTGVYQTGIFYNKEIFQKYGLQVPTTYDQFINVCKTLEAHHITPVWTGISGGATFYLEFMMFPLMQDLISPSLGSTDLSDALATGKVKWTDPRMVTALEEEKTIASNYLEDNYAGQNWQQMPGDFASGKAAMLLDGSWDISSVLQANPKMQIGYFPLPGSNTAADNQPVSNADLTWVVLNNSKNKTLAEKWLSFFATPSIYSQYVDATGISPSESGSYTSATAKIMGKWFGQGRLIQQTPNFLLPSGPYDLQPTNFWNEQLKMLEGGISPAALAQEYQNAQNQVSQ
ncbi:extracellular solute-binding protein [Alicyclobacillus cycloheptanicus]|uniref:Raffinose/stachyose/melibiose transport system substrate-binding protein n=1 Tax=Alicyclobacillus cycloheptanicus TaxID=1457 RepID=A0ABT9XHR7_9BACL|nr:extracellular solute-binding protein [Alicyclobacillus cycloheptanicus]MDQ0189846.1 raffinose/stachyose/melibiose transport system substrate-binding protein [Alicyclobacillus cycloheptanicus]WDM02469.1 extracellular solute-binding protein [Alicyclobacillus cycloheptanicus]